MKLVGGDGRGRSKVWGVHIIQHTGIELPAFGIPGYLFQITHDYEQAALTHLELEDKPQLVVALNIVDDLHYRTVVLVRIIQDEGMTCLHHGEPLPRCMLVGWKIAEQRVLWVAEQTERTGRHLLLIILRYG